MPENMSQSDIDALIKSLLTGEQPQQPAAQPAAAEAPPAAPQADAAAAAMVAPPPAAPAAPVTVIDLGPITPEELAEADAAYEAAKAGVPPAELVPPVIPVDGPATPAYVQPAPPPSNNVDELVALLGANPPATPAPTAAAPPSPPAAPAPAQFATVAQPQAQRPLFPMTGVPVTVSILMDVRLTMTVRLGKTQMKLKDVLNLAPGAVITLESLAHEPLDVLINSIPVMKAEAVVIGENYGVRIAESLIHSQLAAS